MRDWSKQLFAAVGDSVDGSPRRKWAAMHTAMGEMTEKDVSVDLLRKDKEALEFDITSCAFAAFFRALGEPELGALLVCETDFDIAAASGGDVTLTRDADDHERRAKLYISIQICAALRRNLAHEVSGTLAVCGVFIAV